MKEKDPEPRSGKILIENKESEVVILDNGEGLNPEGKGSIPNHDKIEIVYPQQSK